MKKKLEKRPVECAGGCGRTLVVLEKHYQQSCDKKFTCFRCHNEGRSPPLDD